MVTAGCHLSSKGKACVRTRSAECQEDDALHTLTEIDISDDIVSTR